MCVGGWAQQSWGREGRGGEDRERERCLYSTCTLSVGAWTCLSCYQGSLTQPQLSANFFRVLLFLFFLFKVEGKKKCMVTAILSQHRRGLPFVFYKKINKKYWKILIFPFIFFFNLVEFWSFLENYVTLERALEFTTSCKEDTQNAYKQFGAPAHTRPNTVHKQWWKVGCNFFFLKPC